MVFLLLVAGHETTVHLISNAVCTLLQHPAAKAELLNDWSKSGAAIEEVLRYASPLQMAKPRFVANDMEFLGEQLKRGQMVTPLLACANYDPARFENPERFDINRERNYHMSFGSGPHVCLGIKLARTETHWALKSLFDRWPAIQPGFDLEHPDWSKRIGTRGFQSMILKVKGSIRARKWGSGN
jgi:cytochrome P450